jgi:uncharacterized protein (TIGR02145 family)
MKNASCRKQISIKLIQLRLYHLSMHMKNYKSVFVLVFLISFLSMFSFSCKKDNDIPAIETGSVTDMDGNVYATVKIGSKWWMAENLKVTRYSNGDSVTLVSQTKPDLEWSTMKTGAYCYFDQKFGFLYNFYTVHDSRKIAPAGWHIPTDSEWKELETTLGMSAEDTGKLNWRGSDQGNKLKIVGGNTMYWTTSSDIYKIFGTNSSGFTALGGACRVFSGLWGDLTHTGFWWTSTSDENGAWYRGLDYDKTNIFRYYGPVNYGFSIRCVKD